ncbi:caspase family protein [Streptomyces lanatus]|uniref:Caspase family protein n=1 Tax=Streptomyces lanatus TaxID=66900 RepID=A0ABV1XUF7_9ACTN|nr:caspase family protein [Streptomyces lanatus]GHH11674.1 hypothetical protein GCM10018780_49540 [Streptomyces lanatus]
MGARRLLLAGAVTRYPLAPELDRPELTQDVERMCTLLRDDFGYAHQPVLPPDPTGEQLRHALRDFAVDGDRRDDDYVLLYLAGHGDVVDGGQHVLLPSDHRPGDPLGRGVKTVYLTEWLLEQTRIKRLMVILDCCYAGQGGKDLATAAIGGWDGQGSLVVVTSTRPRQAAQAGVFTQAFARAVRNEDRAVGGFTAPALSVPSLVDRIRHDVQVPGFQTPVPLQYGVAHDLEFLPNPHYRPSLVDLDVETQERLYRQQHEHLETRFLPATQWFTGRHRALRQLTGWLADPSDRRLHVVTGDPDSGKTAVLGLLAALSDPDRRPGVPRRGLPEQLPPPRAIDVAVYAGTMTTVEVLTAIGAGAAIRIDPGLNSSEQLRRLVTALRDRPRDEKPLTVLVDALDEAAEPQALAQRLDHLLRLLGKDDGGLRLLLGTRRHLLEHLHPSAEVIDLDDSTHADLDSTRAYARTVLLQSHAGSPYRQSPEELLLAVAEAVAAAAGPSFLIARILAQYLAARAEPADPTDEGWRRSLPRTAGDAMSRDLTSRLGDQLAARARELLLPLAYAQGAGLPREEGIWARLVDALHPGPGITDDSELTWLRRQAGSYFKEANGSLYRLFHQSLVEHLLQGRDAAADQAAIARTLIDCVPPAAQHRRGWPSAHTYIHTHLAAHAVQGHLLDILLADPDYLLTATRAPLLAILRHADSDEAKAAANAYRRAALHLSDNPAAERASYLELAAHCSGTHHLAKAIAAHHPHRPWSTRWARWQPIHPHLTLTGHTGFVYALAMARLEARPVAVSAGGDGVVQVWDLDVGSPVGAPFTGHTGAVYAVAVARSEGHSVVVSAGADGAVRVWDLATRVPLGAPFTGYGCAVYAVAVAELEGRTVVVSAGVDGVVWVWDLEAGSPVGAPFTDHTGSVYALAVAELDGRPVVVSAGTDGAVRVWDLATRALIGDPFTTIGGTVNAVTVTRLEDRAVVVSVDAVGVVWVWDLATRAPVGEPFTGHRTWVRALAVAHLDGRPVVVSGDIADRTAWVWDLATREPVGKPFTGHTSGLRALAVAELDGRPVVVSAGDDRTVRIWDLDASNPVDDSFTGSTSGVRAVTVARMKGRPVVVSVDADRVLRIWDVHAGDVVEEPVTGHNGTAHAVAVAELQDRAVVVSGDARVRVWELATGGPIGIPVTAHKGGVRALAVTELDGRPVVVTAGHDRTIQVWDLATRQPVGKPVTAHKGAVRALATTELDGRPVIMSTGDDLTLHIWDLTDHRPVRTLRLVRADGSAWRLVRVSAGRGGWWRGRLRNLRRAAPDHRRHDSQDTARVVAYLPDSRRAVVGHGRLIEIEDSKGRQVIELEAEVLALAAAAHTVVAATELGVIVLDVPECESRA